jgi:hypothetical protein
MRQTFSLEGEDVLSQSILRSVDLGRYLDIGCADPTEISNTYLFYQKGWRGVAVDGRSELAKAWAVERPGDVFIPCLLDEVDGEKAFWSFPDPTMSTCDEATATRYAERFADHEYMVENRRTRSANSLWMEVYGQDSPPPEFVSIDVEGNELPILKGLLLSSWKPALLVVETKLFSFDDPYAQPIVNFLCRQFGYVLIAKTPLDAFFINPENPLFEWIPHSMRWGSAM